MQEHDVAAEIRQLIIFFFFQNTKVTPYIHMNSKF